MIFFHMIFFQVIFDFRFFRTFQRFKKYYIFFFPFPFSIPFLIHCKPSAIPKHKSYYNVYNIYKYSITFYPAIIASVPGFTALQILQQFQMVKQSRRNVPYIYITLCTTQLLFYTLSIMQF